MNALGMIILAAIETLYRQVLSKIKLIRSWKSEFRFVIVTERQEEPASVYRIRSCDDHMPQLDVGDHYTCRLRGIVRYTLSDEIYILCILVQTSDLRIERIGEFRVRYYI